jgi:hypothetical protein
MNAMPKERPGGRALLWAYGPVLLCGVIPNAVASDLIHNMSGDWAPAAALSLTLITVMMGPKK